MRDVVTIAPLAGDPGLVAYEGPNCKHVTSVLVPPSDPKARAVATKIIELAISGETDPDRLCERVLAELRPRANDPLLCPKFS